MTPRYTELQTTTNFSFLRGASHIEELFAQAALFGHDTLGITDRNSLAGIVRAHQRGKEANVRPIIGCRLDLTDGTVRAGLPDRPPTPMPGSAACSPRARRAPAKAPAASPGTISPPMARA